MAVTNYFSVGDRLLGEETNGVSTGYMTDHLGSVVGTLSGGAVQNRYVYSPYGRVVSKTGTAPDPRFMWNGGTGSRATGLDHVENYNRRRHYSSTEFQWTTRDPLWPRQRPYGYVHGRVTTMRDPRGLAGFPPACIPCASCLIDLLILCPPGMSGWSQCVQDVWNNLPPWLKFACGLACAGCLTAIGGSIGGEPVPPEDPLPPGPEPLPPGPDPLPPGPDPLPPTEGPGPCPPEDAGPEPPWWWKWPNRARAACLPACLAACTVARALHHNTGGMFMCGPQCKACCEGDLRACADAANPVWVPY